MRPWRLRLATRRSRVQWALLSVVLLVSVLSATLLGTLSLLSVATETFAARAAMDGASAQSIRITHRVSPSSVATVAQVEEFSAAAVAEQLGAIPFTSHVTAQSVPLAVPREDRPIALGYLATDDRLESLVTLADGAWPQARATGPLEVLVPPRLMWDLDASIGDVVELAPVATRSAVREVRIVGTYVALEPGGDAWRYDDYRGEGYRPRVAVPFTGGMITTDGYGPFFTHVDNMGSFPLESVTTEHVPDFSRTTTEQLRAVITSTESGERTAQRVIGDRASDVRVVTIVDQTLGGVVGSLAITRSSVLVTGLLLLVLAVAALSQTARLMSERRHAEQHLMIARGGSVRQMVWLAFLEALGLAVITTAAAAPLARLAYLQVASVPAMQDAGMNRDPGLPVSTWVVTGVVGVALLLVLVAPLMRRTGSFVDAEQAKSRPGRRAAFQRSGLDIAVVAIAALAYWQLRNYRSPVLSTGGVASVDPLLAAGPALALLAGALVAVRLIPAASRLMEGLASRGRRAVMPLASWEVGRRAARAVSAVLLLTLAISIGAFSLSFLTTWQVSQQDQARFQHPPDVIVTGVEGPWLTQWNRVSNAELEAVASPVYSQGIEIDSRPENPRRNQLQDRFRGIPVWFVATDNVGLKVYGRDRLHEAGGSRVPSTLSNAESEEVNPIELPGEPEGLRATVSASVSNPELTDGYFTVRAVLRDASHNYLTVDMGQIPMDGEEYVLTGRIGDRSQLALMDLPLSLVGLQTTFGSTGDAVLSPTQGGTLAFTVRANVSELQVIRPIQAFPVKGVPDFAESTPVELPRNVGWFTSGAGLTPQPPDNPTEGVYSIQATTTPTAMRLGGARLVTTASPVIGQVPIVASGGALDAQGAEVGDPVRLSVNNTLLNGYFAQRLPRLPGATLRSSAVAAHLEDIQIALIQQGGTTVEADEWWITVPEENVAAYVDSLPEGLHATTRAGLAQEFTLDPLRIGIQAALWLVAGAAAILAATGFAVHAVVTVRAREVEFAQLRAVGIQRGQLLRVIMAESVLLSILGVVFGLSLGIALAYLVAPLVSVGADGRAPIPAVNVIVPWNTVSLLALEVVLVVSVTMVIVASMLRRINPAQMLRLGDER